MLYETVPSPWRATSDSRGPMGLSCPATIKPVLSPDQRVRGAQGVS